MDEASFSSLVLANVGDHPKCLSYLHFRSTSGLGPSLLFLFIAQIFYHVGEVQKVFSMTEGVKVFYQSIGREHVLHSGVLEVVSYFRQ